VHEEPRARLEKETNGGIFSREAALNLSENKTAKNWTGLKSEPDSDGGEDPARAALAFQNCGSYLGAAIAAGSR